MTGITLVHIQQTTHVGSQIRLFTILVHPVGVSLTVEVLVSGQRRLALGKLLQMNHYMTVLMREWTSPASSVQQVPFGILLRVVAATTTVVSAMLAAAAVFGLKAQKP